MLTKGPPPNWAGNLRPVIFGLLAVGWDSFSEFGETSSKLIRAVEKVRQTPTRSEINIVRGLWEANIWFTWSRAAQSRILNDTRIKSSHFVQGGDVGSAKQKKNSGKDSFALGRLLCHMTLHLRHAKLLAQENGDDDDEWRKDCIFLYHDNLSDSLLPSREEFLFFSSSFPPSVTTAKLCSRGRTAGLLASINFRLFSISAEIPKINLVNVKMAIGKEK